MTWARIDDSFHHHPKPMKVSLSALGLFALGLSYAADNQTRGRLPEKWVLGRIVGDDQSSPQQLVTAGLWQQEGAEFVIHDYHDYNFTPEELEEQRNGSRKRKQKSRDIRRDIYVKDGVTQGMGMGKGMGKEFEDWLKHYQATTGKTNVRGSKPARDAFASRRRDGYSTDDLKLATVGCHGDDFCRENGHDVPETILRASKVTRYIELGRGPKGDISKASKYAGKEREMKA